MSQLDHLVAKIQSDSDAKARDILDNAKREAEALIQSKTQEAENQAQELLASAKTDSDREKAQIIAGKNLELRDSKLGAKQEMIDRVFSLALKKLQELPQADFEKFVINQLLQMDIVGDEKIVLPKAYASMGVKGINGALAAAGRPASLTQGEGSVENGFMLYRGGVENNNTFPALLDFYRSDLEPLVVENLF